MIPVISAYLGFDEKRSFGLTKRRCRFSEIFMPFSGKNIAHATSSMKTDKRNSKMPEGFMNNRYLNHECHAEQ
jgi:hypothetical protein